MKHELNRVKHTDEDKASVGYPDSFPLTLTFFILYGILVFFSPKGHYSFANNQKSHLDTQKEEHRSQAYRSMCVPVSWPKGHSTTTVSKVVAYAMSLQTQGKSSRLVSHESSGIPDRRFLHKCSEIASEFQMDLHEILWDVSLSAIMTSSSPEPHSCQ